MGFFTSLSFMDWSRCRSPYSFPSERETSLVTSLSLMDWSRSPYSFISERETSLVTSLSFMDWSRSLYSFLSERETSLVTSLLPSARLLVISLGETRDTRGPAGRLLHTLNIEKDELLILLVNDVYSLSLS